MFEQSSFRIYTFLQNTTNQVFKILRHISLAPHHVNPSPTPDSGIAPSSGTGFDEVEPDDCVSMVQLATQKCLEKEALCNEFYLQLIKQTTDQPGTVSLTVHPQ